MSLDVGSGYNYMQLLCIRLLSNYVLKQITIHTVPNYIFPNIVGTVMTVKWDSYSPYWPYDLWKRYEVADINLEMFI